MKDDRNLFSRCLLICRPRPLMDLKQILGMYEVTTIPRAIFYADGSMVHSAGKSKLMHLLENLTTSVNTCPPQSDVINKLHVAIVDAMAEVHTSVTRNAVTVNDLADSFCCRIFHKYTDFDEIHAIFDTYIGLHNSLKSSERNRRQQGEQPIRYKIEGSTKIKNVPLRKNFITYTNKRLNH